MYHACLPRVVARYKTLHLIQKLIVDKKKVKVKPHEQIPWPSRYIKETILQNKNGIPMVWGQGTLTLRKSVSQEVVYLSTFSVAHDSATTTWVHPYATPSYNINSMRRHCRWRRRWKWVVLRLASTGQMLLEITRDPQYQYARKTALRAAGRQSIPHHYTNEPCKPMPRNCCPWLNT